MLDNIKRSRGLSWLKKYRGRYLLNKREKRERKELIIDKKRRAGDKNYKEDPTGHEALRNIKTKYMQE